MILNNYLFNNVFICIWKYKYRINNKFILDDVKISRMLN